MKNYQLFVGIDLCKKTMDIVYGPSEAKKAYISLTNDSKGIAKLLKIAAQYKEEQVLICCEHTGVYMDKLAYALSSTNITLWAVHPLLLNYYSVELNRFKTDKADADKIFSYCITNSKKAIPYKRPDQKTFIIRELFTLRKQLIYNRTQWINRKITQRCQATPLTIVNRVYEHMDHFLNTMIRQIDQEISQQVASSNTLKTYYQILLSVPGIGKVIAHHILFATDGFKKFKNWKTFAAYIGTAPYPKQSGTIKKPARLSPKAYRALKADLHQGAISVCRKGQIFHSYYLLMRRKNYHHLDIMNRIKNILIKLIFSLIARKEKFDQHTFINNKKSFRYLQMS